MIFQCALKGQKVSYVSYGTLQNAIEQIDSLIKDDVTAWVTLEAQSGTLRTDNGLKAMIQGLVGEVVDDKLRSVVL